MSTTILDEQFSSPQFDCRLGWFNPPSKWHVEPATSCLVVSPDAPTDFWQRTHYGFSADTGHIMGLELAGDFALATEVAFHPAHQYDQAGLMIRANSDFWIKTSVEHEVEGPSLLGVVVTNHGYSDWSWQPMTPGVSQIRLRLTKRGFDVTAAFGAPGRDDWHPMRVARLHHAEGADLLCGVYACSPKGPGFRAEFRCLHVTSG